MPSRSKNTFLIFIIFSLISFISVEGVHAHCGQEKCQEAEHEGELCAEFIDKARQGGSENRAEGLYGIERAHDKIAVLALSEGSGFVLNERKRHEVEREENDVYDIILCKSQKEFIEKNLKRMLDLDTDEHE